MAGIGMGVDKLAGMGENVPVLWVAYCESGVKDD
jgi:hypothetical protein